MGIISSTYMKPENSEHYKSQNNNKVASDHKLGPPEKERDSSDDAWVDRMIDFIEERGCNEALADFHDCMDEADQKKNDSTAGTDCADKLFKCMEAHSDFYRAMLPAENTAIEVMKKADFMQSNVPLTEQEEDERLIAFIKGGSCKEPFMAWYDCNRSKKLAAKKNKEYFETKCSRLFSKMSKCMEVHSDYYHPLLAAKKASKERCEKELKAFFGG